MSEFSFEPFGDKPLRVGPEMWLIDPFTANERWVRADSPEAQEWLAKQPKPAPTLTVTKVDHESGTVTLS